MAKISVVSKHSPTILLPYIQIIGFLLKHVRVGVAVKSGALSLGFDKSSGIKFVRLNSGALFEYKFDRCICYGFKPTQI